MSLYLGNLTSAVHFSPVALPVNVTFSVFPFPFTCNVILSGLFPASFLLSFHTFSTCISALSFGVLNVFVTTNSTLPFSSGSEAVEEVV